MIKIYKLYAIVEKDLMIEGNMNSDYQIFADSYSVLIYLNSDFDVQNLKDDMKNYAFKNYTILETYEL